MPWNFDGSLLRVVLCYDNFLRFFYTLKIDVAIQTWCWLGMKLWCIFEAFNEICWFSMLVVEENAVDDMCFSTCSWIILTTLYEICIILYLLKWIMLIYLACKHIHYIHFIRCTFCISTYTPASYRIANREPSRHTRGARGAARGAASRGDRSRRGGRWRTSRVPRSPPKLLQERQVPEHFSPPVCNY
jgi:hypothetical protein